MKILLDFFFPVTAVSPTPQASTAFLKQACLVVKPKGAVPVGVITLCTSMAQVTALTDNTEAQQLFDAGMNRVYILTASNLNLAAALDARAGEFYTLIVSSDFVDADITLTQAQGVATITSFANLLTGTADTLTIEGVVFTAQAGAVTPGAGTFQAATSNDLTAASLAAQINAHPVTSLLVVATVVGAVVTLKSVANGFSGNDIDVVYTDGGVNVGLTLTGLVSGKLSGGAGLMLGGFKGVTGVSSTNDVFLALQAAIENRVAFHTTSGNKAKNMAFAFGKLLSNALDWSNQQYIPMPLADDTDTLGEANALFDSKISFVISDDEFSNRLSLFAVGGKAIVAPYIERNLTVDMQSRALSYISGNQPSYSLTDAALLEDELQKVIDLYISRGWITAGEVDVRLEAENFVASAYMNIAEPKALWRIFGVISQTL